MDEDWDQYERVNLWSTSEYMADMWAVHASKFSDQGALRGIMIRRFDEQQGPLAVSLFLEPDPESRAESRDVGGFLHLLPSFTIDDDLLVTSFFGVLTPWLSPALAGLRGYPPDGVDHGRTWYITYEQPWEMHSFGTAGKGLREEMQVDRFCTDSLLRIGETPYDSYDRGADPPDFVCKKGEERINLECTQFVVEQRRTAQAFLGRLRKQVAVAVRKERDAFAHLAGLIVFLRFGDSNGRDALPPAPSNYAAIREVIEALKSYTVEPDSLRLDISRPESLPEIPVSGFTFGGTLHVAPLQGGVPETLFLSQTGFELGFGHLTKHTFDSAWGQLQDIVSKKDVPGAQDLLVSVGSPSHDGLIFPSDELVADIACRSERSLQGVRHLERVFLHFWSSKRIVQMWPRKAEVPIGEMAVSFVPAHSRLGSIEKYGPYVEALDSGDTSAAHEAPRG